VVLPTGVAAVHDHARARRLERHVTIKAAALLVRRHPAAERAGEDVMQSHDDGGQGERRAMTMLVQIQTQGESVRLVIKR
jgi:hypothetical protein